MRSLIILGAAASLLTLTACNRDTAGETSGTDAAAAGDMGADASATLDAGASPAPATSDSTPAPYPADEAAPAATDGPGPVTDATRAGAKEKAESTNLHP